jgi:hypothetical protein
MNNNESSPKTMRAKIWSCANSKVKKTNWSFALKKERGSLPEISSTIKPKTFGSKIYKMGPYEGTLEELKEFAAIKNLPVLRNGAISYKVA